MAVEFYSQEATSVRLCIEKFDEVSERLKKGKIDPTDLPTINEAFDIIKKMIEDAARKQGMTYEEFVSYVRKKEKEAREKKQDPEQSAETPANQPNPTPTNDNKPNPDNTNENIPDKKDKKTTKDGRKKSKGGKKPGSGKKSLSPLAKKTTEIPIHGIAAGCSCPSCHNGKVYSVAPGVIGRIMASATFVYEEILVEKLRCNSCGQTIAAEVPPEIKEDHVRGASFDAAAALMVMRYYLGIPNRRIERLNGYLETPLSDARQWDIMHDAAKLLRPIFEALLLYVANSSVQILDDGWCRIICIHRAIQREIKTAEMFGIDKEKLRTGVNTTVLIGYEGTNAVSVYVSGRRHQGENAHILNNLRTKDTSVIRMTDAASKTTSTHEFPKADVRGFVLAHGDKVVLDSRTQEVFCLTHLRNKFADVSERAPELCKYIIDRIADIYKIEDEAGKANLDSAVRLLSHQIHSTPLVEAIRAKVSAELLAKNWLPKDPVGQALSYAKKHLDDCTGFLRLQGCPLDSNAAERGIITVVRHRLASLAYQTDEGAAVGDIAMTLAGSAVLAKENPVKYISACLEFHSDVCQNPELWFPWNYKSQYTKMKDLRITEREAREIKSYRIVHRKRPILDEIDKSHIKPFEPEVPATVH